MGEISVSQPIASGRRISSRFLYLLFVFLRVAVLQDHKIVNYEPMFPCLVSVVRYREPENGSGRKKGKRKLVLSKIKRYLPASGCTVALQRLVTSCSRGLMPTVPSAAIWRPRGGNCFVTVFRVSLAPYFTTFLFLLVQDLHNMYLLISCVCRIFTRYLFTDPHSLYNIYAVFLFRIYTGLTSL